uniref:Uncharacterized protein n=1 Tax=Solanum lycopersicum TaxID=4081 RepID=A0A3Q7EH74_SOLLC
MEHDQITILQLLVELLKYGTTETPKTSNLVEAFGPWRAVVELVSEFCCENLLGKLGEPIASLSQLSIENIDDLGNSASFDGNSDGL